MAQSVHYSNMGREQAKRPVLLFALLILSLPFQATAAVDFGITITIYLVLGLVFTLKYHRFANLLRIDKFDVSIFLFLLWASLSLLYNTMAHPEVMEGAGSGLRGSALRGVMHLLRFGFLWVFYKTLRNYLLQNPSELRRFFKLLVIVGTFLGIYGGYQLIGQQFYWPFINLKTIHSPFQALPVMTIPDIGNIYRVFGTFAEPLNYANFLLVLIPLLFAYYLIQRSKQDSGFSQNTRAARWWLGLLLGLLLVNFFLTFSRGAYLSFAVGVGFLAVVTNIKGILRYGKYALSIGVPVILLLYTFTTFYAIPPGKIMQFFVSSYFNSEDLSRADRLQKLAQGLQIFQTEPIFGVGLGNDAYYQAEAARENPRSGVILSSISFVGYLLANTGFVGFTLFMLFLLGHILESLKSMSRVKKSSPTYTFLLFSTVAIVMTFSQMATFEGAFELYVWVLLALNWVFNRLAASNRLQQVSP